VDDPFEAIAPYYDWEHESFSDDMTLYRGFAEHTGGPVLELACGTGRLLAPLVAAGADVEGVDASSAMLDLARARLAKIAGWRGTGLHHADLSSFTLPRPFAFAFIALDSFGLLLDRQAQLACLRRTREHLLSGGLLVVDVGNGNARGDVLAYELRHVLTAPHPSGQGLLTKWAAVETNASEQVDAFTYFYDHLLPSGEVRRTIAGLSVRFFYRFELELLVEHAGFKIETLYGSYGMDPYVSESARLIVVARRS
jgi:SAM-dependent methyltransferase